MMMIVMVMVTMMIFRWYFQEITITTNAVLFLNRISALNIFWYNRTPLLLFFSGSGDNTVRLWDVASQQEVAVLRGHTGTVYSVAFDGSGRFLASGERTWRGDDEEWRGMIE